MLSLFCFFSSITLKENALFLSVIVAVKLIRLRFLSTHLELFSRVQDGVNFFGLLSSFIVFILSNACCQSRLKKKVSLDRIFSSHTSQRKPALLSAYLVHSFFHFHEQSWWPANCRLKGDLSSFNYPAVHQRRPQPSARWPFLHEILQTTCQNLNFQDVSEQRKDLPRSLLTWLGLMPSVCFPSGYCRRKALNCKQQLFHWSAAVSNSIHDFLIAKHSLPQQKYLFNGNQIWVIKLKPIKLYVS